jgi:hypothetical protein
MNRKPRFKIRKNRRTPIWNVGEEYQGNYWPLASFNSWETALRFVLKEIGRA